MTRNEVRARARGAVAGPVVIRFGALVPKLKEQLTGLRFPPGALGQFQRDADAVTRLLLRGIVTEGEAKCLRARLVGLVEGAQIKGKT